MKLKHTSHTTLIFAIFVFVMALLSPYVGFKSGATNDIILSCIFGDLLVILGVVMLLSYNQDKHLLADKDEPCKAEAQILWEKIFETKEDHIVCPNCGAVDTLLKGPSGGVCTNVKCSECEKKYNIYAHGSFKWAEELD